MSENSNFGFARLVPGFDFLQNIAKGAQNAPQMPTLSNWIAPTLNVEELDKRISELKAVHFWLDQNSKALSATIQALEVQKMTLATLRGMNLNMGELANAMKLKTAEAMGGGAQKAAAGADAADAADGAGAADAAEGGRRKSAGKSASATPGGKAGNGAAGPVDPMQWWGALTQQFQEIAASAMRDVAQKTAVDAAKNMAAETARKPAKGAKKTAPRKKAARKAPGGK